jgi:hypothetical protein
MSESWHLGDGQAAMCHCNAFISEHSLHPKEQSYPNSFYFLGLSVMQHSGVRLQEDFQTHRKFHGDQALSADWTYVYLDEGGGIPSMLSSLRDLHCCQIFLFVFADQSSDFGGLSCGLLKICPPAIPPSCASRMFLKLPGCGDLHDRGSKPRLK